MYLRFLPGAALVAILSVASVAGCTSEPPAAAPAGDPDAGAAATEPVSTEWNDRARFLAGLPVPASSPLAALEVKPHWKDHQKVMDADWVMMGERIARMKEWAAAELDPRVDPTLPLMYIFGGPDALTAVTLFPQARAYVLAGLEAVGQVAPPETLADPVLDKALDGIAYALRTAVKTSFFVTDQMGRDLTANQTLQIRGVLPILMLFLARCGTEVVDVQHVSVDPLTGVATAKAPGAAPGKGLPGARLTIRRAPGAPTQELTYVSADLYNDKVAATPGFFSLFKQYAPGNALLKAASFILEDNHFSRTRDFLLANAVAVLQEDSGIPFHFFKPAQWEATCFGPYQRPRPPFQVHYQRDLAQYCAAQEPKRSLPFIIGYRRPEDSNLLLAVRKEAVKPPSATP
jgi:hypothetical protein